jgi:hypothetical protein
MRKKKYSHFGSVFGSRLSILLAIVFIAMVFG